jgi:DNA-binding response OmpR family regulator
MRGTVLLLAGPDWSVVYAEQLRENGLRVYELPRPEDALRQVDAIGPDVVVAVYSGSTDPAAIRELRGRVDHATSIIAILATGREDCTPALGAGADSVLLMPAPPGEVLYEVQRALILRRSGRRLPQQK